VSFTGICLRKFLEFVQYPVLCTSLCERHSSVSDSLQSSGESQYFKNFFFYAFLYIKSCFCPYFIKKAEEIKFLAILGVEHVQLRFWFYIICIGFMLYLQILCDFANLFITKSGILYLTKTNTWKSKKQNTG